MSDCDRVASGVDEFCRSVGIGRTRFYADVKSGKIEIVKIGRKTLVPVAERVAYLQRMAKKH